MIRFLKLNLDYADNENYIAAVRTKRHHHHKHFNVA